jgi:hypothetical protein
MMCLCIGKVFRLVLISVQQGLSNLARSLTLAFSVHTCIQISLSLSSARKHTRQRSTDRPTDIQNAYQGTLRGITENL